LQLSPFHLTVLCSALLFSIRMAFLWGATPAQTEFDTLLGN